jgi:hypothetical protein
VEWGQVTEARRCAQLASEAALAVRVDPGSMPHALIHGRVLQIAGSSGQVYSGTHASGVCKAYATGLNTHRSKPFWVCCPGSHGRHCYRQLWGNRWLETLSGVRLSRQRCERLRSLHCRKAMPISAETGCNRGVTGGRIKESLSFSVSLARRLSRSLYLKLSLLLWRLSCYGEKLSFYAPLRDNFVFSGRMLVFESAVDSRCSCRKSTSVEIY